MKAKTAAQRKDADQARPHLEIHVRDVDNPDFSRDHEDGKLGNFRKIRAAINVRESGIETMYARGHVNDAQREAAIRFRYLFEAMGGSGARAIDWRKEAVDGGRFPDPIGNHAIDAGKKLALAYEEVVKEHGMAAWRLIGYTCGEGMTVAELTHSRRERDTMLDNLRTYLDCLAAHWGLAMRSRVRIVPSPKQT